MKKILIILLLTINPVLAENIEPMANYNVSQLLQDDNLTYKVIKGCVSLNSAVTELIKEEHPDLANDFFKTANFLYPFGILTLSKVRNINREEAEKEYFSDADNLTNDYMDYMEKNGVINQSFIKGTFLGGDLAFCNEIRSAIEITINESSNKK